VTHTVHIPEVTSSIPASPPAQHLWVRLISSQPAPRLMAVPNPSAQLLPRAVAAKIVVFPGNLTGRPAATIGRQRRTLDAAKLRVHGDELVVRLSTLEKLGAFRGGVHLPLAAVRSTRVSARPWSELPALLMVRQLYPPARPYDPRARHPTALARPGLTTDGPTVTAQPDSNATGSTHHGPNAGPARGAACIAFWRPHGS
jgi:hypothetical protein